MGPVGLYLKAPATSRFLTGGLAEVEALFGSPLPPLPPPEREGERQAFFVRFHPQFRSLLQRYLFGMLREIGGEGAMGPVRGAEAGGRDQGEYEAALAQLLRSVRSNDRRMGLNNLFWLAHSRDVAESLRDLEAKIPAVRKLKYSLHPLLSSLYRRLDQQARRATEQADPTLAAFRAGSVENGSLVEALLDDGIAFLEPSVADLDFNQFLAANKRYRLAADVFFEIYTVLVRETERRLRENDRGLLARMARHLPGLPTAHARTPGGAVKVTLNTEIMIYLLADAWQTGSRLMTSPRLKAEIERRKPAEVMEVFLDLITGVKRFEVVCHLREKIQLLRAFDDQRALDDRVSRARIYEFGESAQLINNAANATVLFLDLRGFTATSEGQISERDLTRELYTVFDAFVPHVRRFGGIVDKFLGDGIMITYGTDHAEPLSPLQAVRTAILCQETLKSLRQQRRTDYKMGIAVHYGRVYLARFLADEESVQTTVIGRNVNLAGRLSSASKRPMDEDEEEHAAVLRNVIPDPEFMVKVEPDGTLMNEGIAISREALSQLEAHLSLVHTERDGQGLIEYFDEQIGRRILFKYAGDAKFKGVRSSFPVYAVGFEC
jgi:class 3 adenylate cyclase